jgi:alanine dehydrogenase
MTKSISLLKEAQSGERRVLLVPSHIRQFRTEGFEVFVERDAGTGIGYSDNDYRAVGANIVDTKEAWYISPFAVKYRAPTPEEFKFLHKGLHLGAIYHAEGDKSLIQVLCESGITAYSYEFFQTPDGIFPLSVPGSEIAGKLAILYGAYYLQSHTGGAGILFSHVVGVQPPKVVIIGYGNAGAAAARLSIAMGAEVVVLGTHPERLRRFQATVPSSVKCYLTSPEVLEQELPTADLVLGAILISTYDTPSLIGENLVRRMKKGSVIIDITCGYGVGYLPTFPHFTTFEEPMVERFGVLHCKIDILPSAVPKTASQAISHVITPYLIALGNSLFDPSAHDSISAAGKIIEAGRILHPEVQRHMDMRSRMEGSEYDK